MTATAGTLTCTRCKHPARRLIGGWCETCSYPGGDGPAGSLPVIRRAPTGPPCDGCGQELLLVRPGRTTCERCRLDGPHTAA
jgi:hypothetical protein